MTAVTERRTHTPGPWIWLPHPNEHFDKGLFGSDGQVGYGIMLIKWNRDQRNHAADARLIAAAPDLLSCCKSVLLRLDLEADNLGGDNPKFLCSTKRDMLRTAITAAEGAMT